jgi:hypothetical protein
MQKRGVRGTRKKFEACVTLGTEAAVVLFARAPALERTGRNTSAIHLALLLRALDLAAQSSAD